MRRIIATFGLLALAWPLSVGVQAEEDASGLFTGSAELLYRSVDQDGSRAKYDEDYDGLSSGARLSSLLLEWKELDVGFADFLRLEASGLGGDPYERAALRMSKKDRYDFSIGYRQQSVLYNLFNVVPDTDGHVWDAERSLLDARFTYHVSSKIDLYAEAGEVRREGTSLFLKQIDADIFQLDTPLDQQQSHVAVGGRFEIGKVDLLFRHERRRFEYDFDNTTTDDDGLDTLDLTTLDSYAWRQRDRGETDLTTLTVSVPLNDRISLTATAFGTLLGDQTVDSDVGLNASGSSGIGSCSVTNDYCDSATPCPGVPGNVCVAAPFTIDEGSSTASIEAEHLVLDADLSVGITPDLDFHLQARSLQREIDGRQLADLDGNGIADDTEGTVSDTVAGSVTRSDYELNTVTGLFDWAATRDLRVQAGYRSIYRQLERSGFEYSSSDLRNTPFESDRDDTAVLGVIATPAKWVRLDADYEQGDIAQAFSAPMPMETDRLRARARLRWSALRIDLSALAFENQNNGRDFRLASACSLPSSDIDAGCWATDVDGSTFSVSLTHEPASGVDYRLRWARSDIESTVRARFDGDAFFNVAENGDSLFDTTSDLFSAAVNVRFGDNWTLFARGVLNESDGSNAILAPTLGSTLLIQQDYHDVEIGVTHTFPGGLYAGGRFQLLDYDDANDLLDYSGAIFTVVTGINF